MSKSIAQPARALIFGSCSLPFGSRAMRDILMRGLSNDLATNRSRDSRLLSSRNQTDFQKLH